MFQNKFQIAWNRAVAPGVFTIGLTCRHGFAHAKPGQFVMLRVSDGIEPLLRRPFSIHKLLAAADRIEGIELLYKVVGKGTALLAGRRPGETLDVLGPLGSSFVLPPAAGRVYIVAGGMGVAPMVFLARHLVANGLKPWQCEVFLGGRTRTELLCREDFAALDLPVCTTTDDGSAGDRCLVTHPVDIALAARRPDVVFACGPLPMLDCVIGITAARGVRCQVSVETAMACGIGACLGCAVASRDAPDRYYHVCLDGPVFDAATIRFP
ncbi:MAG: dihydroorotate dehydrogenase electron transfer subunit [Desulfobacterales bacterium]